MLKSIPMRRKAKRNRTPKNSDLGALVRKLETAIAADFKIRDAANTRINANRKLLEAAVLVAEHLPDGKAAPTRKPRKPELAAHVEFKSAPHHNDSDAP